jgi:mRNA interferase MazF
MEIRRGDIILVNFEPVMGSEPGGIRPALVIQNNYYNQYSPVVIVASITSKIFTKEFATNVLLSKKDSKLNKDSTILLNQIRTIDKSRIKNKLYSLNYLLMKKVDMALKISMGLE